MITLRSYIPIICTFIIGAAVSLILFVIVNNWEHTNQRIEFESRSRGYASAVQGNLNKYLEALSFLGDFFNNSRQVSRQEFTVFTESALSRHPAIQAFSWNPLVTGNERAVYESLAKKERLKNFRFTERTEEGTLVDAAQRQEYVVVYYIVPLETNKPALGYDIASDATRLQAIDQVFKTGKLTVTDRITLVQETGTQFGVLVFLPLYQQGVSPKTSEARLKYRKGLVVEVLRIGDVVEAALKDFPDEGINLYLYDASVKKGSRLLYARPSRMPGLTEQAMDEEVIQKDIHWSNNFEIAGRQWKLLFTPSPLFPYSKHSWHPWLVLSGSLLLTAILGTYLLKRLTYTAEIESRVREQLRSNQQLASEIAERKQAEDKLRESEERYYSLFNYAVDGMAVGNTETGELTDCNQALCRMVERDRTELIGQHQRILHPENHLKNGLSTSFRLHKAGDQRQVLEDSLLSKSGNIIPVEINAAKIWIKGREYLVGIFRDITDRKQAEDTIRESEQRLHSIVDGSPIPTFVIGKDHRVIHWNKALEEMSRIKFGDIVGTRDHWKAFYNEERPCMADLLVDEDVELIPQWYLGKYVKSPLIEGAYEATDFFPALGEDGKWLRFTAAIIRDSKEMIVTAVETLEDITDHKLAEEALRESEKRYHELSIIDDLTKLYNSRHFYIQLKSETERSNRYGQPLTLLLLDLDDFKRFNDAYGHIEGDRILSQFGQVLKRCLRQTDSAYRYGGEEFTILLPMTTRGDGVVIAERIRAEFKKEIFPPVAGKDVHMTVSIGLAQYKSQEDMKAFVNRVDQLMYQAKKNGKDRICFES